MSTVKLRNILESDLPIFFEQQNDPEANEMAAFPARERDAFMVHWHKILANNSEAMRTILFDGQVAGNIVSFVMDGEREVGYWLGREFWGKGIATSALQQFLEVITERPLFAHVVRHNTGSLRVLQKCGFTVSKEEQFESGNGGGSVAGYVLKLEE
jgi:RimJ/RimL family protein N-acetyltransferase